MKLELFDGDQAIGEWTDIYVPGGWGSILNRDDGFEVFVNNISRGVVADRDDASNAIFDYWNPQSNGGDPHARVSEEPDLQPEHAPEIPRKEAGNGGNSRTVGKEPNQQPEPARESEETDWDALATAKNGGDSRTPMLTAALGLAKQRNWKIFPARMEEGKKYSWLSKEHAPGGENWGMTSDPAQLQRNFTNPKWRSKCGVGVPTGWVNQIFDIEADTKEGHGVDGLASLQKLETKYGKLPDTLMAISPSGSKHRIYNHPGHGIKVISRGLPGYPGVDIKGDGGMFVAPPSVRGDGEYRWLNDLPIADAPQWLIDLVTAKSNGKGADDGAQHPPRLKVSPAFAHLDPTKNVAEGIEYPTADIEDIRSAANAIPPSVITDESGWMGFARALAWEAKLHPEQREVLWEILDTVSQRAPKYDKAKNQDRFDRYINEAGNHEKPITVATLFHLAREHGWQGALQQEEPGKPAEDPGGTPTPAELAEPSFADPYAEFVGPPFPLEVLSPTLVKFVKTEHRAMGVDPSGIAMAVLGNAAGTIHAETMIRAGEGWWEMPILWVFLIGDPSTMKSSIIIKATAPLYCIEDEHFKSWQQEYAAWKQTQQGEQKGKTPPPAKHPRHILDEITPEKVAEVLSRSPRGSLMVHDELASWIQGFERYNAGSSRGFFLRCWKGGFYLKDRVGKGKNDQDAEIRVENLALCVLGGIQPEKLLEIGDLTSDGLLQRALPCLMRPAVREDVYYPVAEAHAQYDKLIRLIDSAPPEKYLFDQGAMEVRDRVSAHLFKLEHFDGFSAALRGAIGKLKGYFARICLVLEVVGQHDPANLTFPGGLKLANAFKHLDPKSLGGGLGTSKAISRETAEAAEKILDEFLLPHIVGLYDVVVSGGQDRDMLRSIGDFILASTKDRLLPSDLTKGVRALRGQPEHKIREWAGRFIGMGWLQGVEARPGVPPKAWLVVPGLREHFAERQKYAEAARAEAHAILKAGGTRKT